LLATELADYLVSKGLPFREAHHVVGRIVKHCEEKNIGFHHLGVEGMQMFHEKFDQEVLVWIDPVKAVERRTSRGGTAWSEVERQAVLLLKTVEGEA
jgi:argininosuccinate lyase